MSASNVIAISIALYLQKLLGVSVPPRLLQRPWIMRVLTLLPVALLSGLVISQTTGSTAGPVMDLRLVGVGVAAIALALRAPFLVVLALAAATTAGVRLLW